MSILKLDIEYKNWISELKGRIQQSQIKAAIKVNIELLRLYWNLGASIVERQSQTKWGDGFIKQLSKDLMDEFPEMKGFSEKNLKYIKRWYLFYNHGIVIGTQVVSQLQETKKSQDFLIGQQVVAQIENKIVTQVVQHLEPEKISNIFQIPWGHNCLIISKCKEIKEALFYVNETFENGWSRSVLEHQIESQLFKRRGNAVTNFSRTLPSTQSDLAAQLMKDPYSFDFLRLTKDYNERDLENALIENVAKFLLELGSGFAFVGKQYHLSVSQKDYYIDLLFYHIKLHCYVVVELKTIAFQPEFTGKLNFYLSAVDDVLKSDSDNQTIGILICKNKNKIEAEYALRDIKKPIGISEYQLTKLFPEKFKGSLPTIEEIEEELQNIEIKTKK